MDNQVEMLQPSLPFSILSRVWGGGVNREGGLLKNLAAQGGLIRGEGGFIELSRDSF